MKRLLFVILFAIALAPPATAADATIGHVTRYDPALDRIIALDAKFEKLADGFTWSEGPLWISSGKYLLFTDVPRNTLYRWSESDGLTVFLKPSGYGGPDRGELREPGANGLFEDGKNGILFADSGNRLIGWLDLATKVKTTVVSAYLGKRLNSPNDVIRARTGDVFFTDPPYGLKGINESPVKEQSFNGVYRYERNGKLSVVDEQLSFPNGIALSPDQHTLYVANSDPKRPIWMAYILDGKGEVTGKREFASAADLMGEGVEGLPDGMKVAADGTLFASAPGGVLIMTADGKRLGRIETGSAIANCAFGEGGRSLYLTSHEFIARVPLIRH